MRHSCLIVLLTVVACGGAGGDAGTTSPPVVPPNVSPAAVTITPPASTTLAPGATAQLSAVVTNSAGTVLSGQTVTWTSSNTVVTVSASGLVTAGTAPGTANVTAKVGAVTSAAVIFTVVAPAPSKISKALDVPASPTILGSYPIKVLVTGANNAPVGGVAVGFLVPPGDGTVTVAGGATGTTVSSISDASGIAAVTWTLGPKAGPQTLNANVPGIIFPNLDFSAQAVPGPPVTIEKVNPDPTGTFNVGTLYRGSGGAVAIVTDAGGNPVPNVVVTFALTNAPSGYINALHFGETTPLAFNQALTGPDGLGSATFIAGSVAGVNTASASATGISAPAVFSITTVNPGAYTFRDLGEILGPENFGIAANTRGYGPADVSAFELSDGRVRLFFGVANATSEVTHASVTGSAISSDGEHFTVEPGYRTAANTVQGGYASPLVYPLPGGGYRWFYVGSGAFNGEASATSTDGVNWVEDAGLRFASPANSTTACGGIVKLTDGRYRLYCSNEVSRTIVSGATIVSNAVFSAISTDLLGWTVEPGYLIGPGAPKFTGDATHPTPIANADGSVSLVFDRFSESQGFIPQEWIATSADGRNFTSEVNTGVTGSEPSLLVRKDGSMLLYHGGFNRPGNSTLIVARVTKNP